MNETLTAHEAPNSRIDEEDIRLTTGFADIFTAIVLVVGASGLLALAGAFGALLITGAAFALGRPIVRGRQFAAASSVLAFGAAFGAGTLGATMVGLEGVLLAAAVCGLHWYVFRVPLALALAWGSLLCTLTAQFLGGGPTNAWDLSSNGVFGLACGTQLLALALAYDARDRLRQTRLSDVAFWLHLAAAPMLVHGLFAAMGTNPFSGNLADPWPVLGIFAGLTLVSLLIDRRPLLVSSFVYLIVAVGTLLTRFQPSASETDRLAAAALAPAIIGVFLLVLAAAWTPLRRAILRPLPALLARLVPPPATNAVPRATAQTAPAAEKEPLRLVLGFNDIFVSLGSTMMFLGCGALAYFLTERWIWNGRGIPGALSSPAPLIWVGLPALSLWLVAEYFVRLRRMAWPAISTAIWFSLTSWIAGFLATQAFAVRMLPQAPLYDWPDPADLPSSAARMLVPIFCAVAVAGNLAFWRRHRTPISFALAVASLLPLLFVDRIVAGQSVEGMATALRLLPAGLATLALAMWWDRSDRERKTQRSDTAFWLHLLASLLVIPPLYSLVADSAFGPLLVAAGFLLLVALAVAIDRRAPLVVALPPVIGSLGSGSGFPGLMTVAISLALLALVLRWEKVRGWLLGLLAREASA